MTVASLFAEIGIDTTPMTGAAADVRRKMQPLQQTFQQIGSTLTRYVTLPLAGLAGVATKTGAAIDREFAQIEGLVGESREALQGMRSDLFDIGTATGVGPEELAEALFFVESAGFRGSEAIQVLEQSAKAAAAGLGETKSVADAVTSAVNAYGQEALSAQRATDVLVSTVREGKVAADSIASSLGRVLGPASEMGVEFNEIGGTLASLTRVGASANRAVTALSAVLRTALKPTQQGREALQELGMSYEELRASISDRGLLPTLQTLRKRFDETDVRITDLFRNARALRGVFGLLGKNAEQVEGVFESMNKEVGGSTTTAFQAARDTIGNQFNRVLRQAQELLDGVYTTFRSQIVSVLKTAQSALESLNEAWDSMSSTMQGVIVSLGAVAAAVGPLLLALSGLMAMAPLVAGALAGLATPLVGGAGLVAALATAAASSKEFRDDVTQAFEEARDAAIQIWNEIGPPIMSALGTIWDTAVKIFKVGTKGLLDITVGFLNLFLGNWQTAFDELRSGWRKLFTDLRMIMIDGLTQIGTDFADFVEETFGLEDVPFLVSGPKQIRAAMKEIRGIYLAQEPFMTEDQQINWNYAATITGDEKVELNYEGIDEAASGALDTIKEFGDEAREAGEKAERSLEELAPSFDELMRRFREATKSVEEGGQAEIAPPVGAIEASLPDQIDRLPVDPEEVERLRKRVDKFWANFEAKAAIGSQAVSTAMSTIGRGFRDLIETGRLFGTEVENIGDAFVGLGNLVKRVIQDILADLAAAAAQALAFRVITGGWGDAGSFRNLVGAFVGGGGPSIQGRATGGPVTAGESYVVGENEPELFTPGTSGRITPMSNVSRGTGRLKVELVSRPEVLPNGDVQFAVEEGGRQQRRRGFPDEG